MQTPSRYCLSLDTAQAACFGGTAWQRGAEKLTLSVRHYRGEGWSSRIMSGDPLISGQKIEHRTTNQSGRFKAFEESHIFRPSVFCTEAQLRPAGVRSRMMRTDPVWPPSCWCTTGPLRIPLPYPNAAVRASLMSAIEGIPDDICSRRAFQLLTRSGRSLIAVHVL